MDSVLKSGYLDYLARGAGNKDAWQRRYYVLHGATPKQESRLDWYRDQTSYETNTAVGKTLYLQHIKGIGICKTKDRQHTIEMTDKHTDRPHVYSFENKESMKDWMDRIKEAKEKKQEVSRPAVVAVKTTPEEIMYDDNAVYEETDPPLVYTVEMSDSEAAVRLGLAGVYTMYVSRTFITLTKPTTGENVISWQYRNIRRYGRSKNTFTLEAGRKCESGEGLFTFRVADGHNLFAAVQERTKQMSRGTPPTPATPTTPAKTAHTLPANMSPAGAYVGLTKTPLAVSLSGGAERNKNRELPKIPNKPSSPTIPPKPITPQTATESKSQPSLIKEIKQKQNEKMSGNVGVGAPKVDFSTHPLLKTKPKNTVQVSQPSAQTAEENIYDEAYSDIEPPVKNAPTDPKRDNMYFLYDSTHSGKLTPSQPDSPGIYDYAGSLHSGNLHSGNLVDDGNDAVYANADEGEGYISSNDAPVSGDINTPMSSIVAMMHSSKLENKIKRKSTNDYDEVNLHKSLVERPSSVGHTISHDGENEYSSVSLDNQKQ